ncbi:hypothetical protein JOD31_002433 [Methylopila capsulata]|uniref:Uncharacterized protein n=1 Tax=Methylopila capsulata TaxID=61654 RepID=A0A9W6MSL7_9HYPH|nr:hypothetical protein [Methylopila capsulata]GLK56397.1 hypothetical protein GCM10008170_24160 [Methylopila capsulata]
MTASSTDRVPEPSFRNTDRVELNSSARTVRPRMIFADHEPHLVFRHHDGGERRVVDLAFNDPDIGLAVMYERRDALGVGDLDRDHDARIIGRESMHERQKPVVCDGLARRKRQPSLLEAGDVGEDHPRRRPPAPRRREPR